MCSIVGAAGPIENLSARLRQEFHEFMSCLFTMAELRGRDAAGFWVWRKNHYVFEKRPIPAEDLIQRSPRWKGLRFNPGSLYLMHTRAATDGDPNENMNNHPHVGEHSVMIHNGMIWGHQAVASQYGLDMKTDCDSEVLLRLAEVMDDMTEGLKFMYESASDSHGTDSIATAFVDRRDPSKVLLSRNSGNPCYVYQSERFGCTFFCSTEDIFERALEMLYKTKSPKVIGAKSEDVQTDWLYSLNADGTLDKEFLVSPTPYGRYQSHYSEWDENDTVIVEPKQYIKVLLGSQTMSVGLSGKIELLAENLEEEEIQEDTSDLEFMETIQMPKEVEMELRGFLDAKIEQGLH
jgi:glucosamine 6-phosphate synthetase-like amidotransferase/phosphosugar isomerase protein